MFAQAARARYWNETAFAAVAHIDAAAKKYDLTLPEVALRWLAHHSMLKGEHGDAILIGVSSVKQTEQNLVDLEKGPLHTLLCIPDCSTLEACTDVVVSTAEDVVKALDEAWKDRESQAEVYYFP